MSTRVTPTGGTTTKNIIAPDGTVLGPAIKAGKGNITIDGGFGSTIPEKVLKGEIFTSDSGLRQEGTFDIEEFEEEVAMKNREGKAVWEVYDSYTPPKTTKISFGNYRFSGNTVYIRALPSNGVGVEELSNETFAGKNILRLVYKYGDNSGWEYSVNSDGKNYSYKGSSSVMGNGGGSFAYNQTTGDLSFTESGGNVLANESEENIIYKPFNTTIPEKIGNMIGYVVSENQTDYPDKGIGEDGRFYIKLASILSKNVLNLTDLAAETTEQHAVDKIARMSSK